MQYAGGFSYVTDKIYHSEYWHLPDGRYEIGPAVLHADGPPRAHLPGPRPETRRYVERPGEERHDFRDDFGIADPYVIPIDVRYSYEGAGDLEGRRGQA